MTTLLTINGIPEHHDSPLPEGVCGELSALTLITIDNVAAIRTAEVQEYEDNCDGEFTFVLNNGDKIIVAGYHGMWEILSYAKLSTDAKVELLANMVGWMRDIAKDIQADS